MRTTRSSVQATRAILSSRLTALTTALAVSALVLAPAALGGTAPALATLQQCATATIPQTERSVTFAGEMTAIAGTARMAMRIGLEERTPGEAAYHTVSASGLGVWHSSVAGVKIFTHIQQVTNLSAPAMYRGALRFRWINDKGRTIKSEELRTAHCEQPAPTGTPPTSTNPTATNPSASDSTGAAATDSTGAGATDSGT